MIPNLIVAIRRNAPWVVGVPAAVALVVLAVGLLRAPVYEGAVVVAPVSSRPGLSGMNLAATVLGTAGATGFQSTPVLVSRLARLDGVLLSVAQEPLDGQGTRVIDRLKGADPGSVDDRAALATMRNVVSSTADNHSGLVTLRVTASDSGLVRVIVRKLLDYTSGSFVETTRAQAAALKHAQDGRLEAALARLTMAEDTLRLFTMTNRATSLFAEAAVTARRLERELRIAEELYTQAVSERESAAARELEASPALVVVDDLPDRIRRKSRGLLLRMVWWSVLALALVLLALTVRGSVFHEQRAGSAKAH
jgi:capsule polysaccharide export protein KpsE/RkpR